MEAVFIIFFVLLLKNSKYVLMGRRIIIVSTAVHSKKFNDQKISICHERCTLLLHISYCVISLKDLMLLLLLEGPFFSCVSSQARSSFLGDFWGV